jgi:DNA modification methylase
MSKSPFQNHLNELEPKSWLLFQKSWFIHNPPPRRKDVLRHPAKFPETMAQEFIEFFTKRGQVVLDPMVGTGSTLVAAMRAGRQSIGIELNPTYANIASEVIAEEAAILGAAVKGLCTKVITGSAAQFARYKAQYHFPMIDYMLTSPPYWDMLHTRGAATQKQRRTDSSLDVYYSSEPEDLGNITDYTEFIERLAGIYEALKPFLRPRAYLTIIVKNVKKGGQLYPLAWDLARRLGQTYTLKDEKLWLQDNQRLFPYGLGKAWVSNTFHHYCLQFRND